MPQINAESIGSVSFDTEPNGYNRDAVDAFLGEVAEHVRNLSAAEPAAAAPYPPAAVEEGPHDRAISQTLREVAARSATEVLESASRDAAEVLDRAEQDAEAIRSAAREATAQAHEQARVVLDEAQQEATRIAERAVEEGRAEGAKEAQKLQDAKAAELESVSAAVSQQQSKLDELVAITTDLRDSLGRLSRDAVTRAASAGDPAFVPAEVHDAPTEDDVTDTGAPLASFLRPAEDDGYDT